MTRDAWLLLVDAAIDSWFLILAAAIARRGGRFYLRTVQS